MNIKKILKFYFVLTLMLAVFAAVSYNDDFRRYMSTYGTSVLNYKFSEPKAYTAVYSPEISPKKTGTEARYYRENPYNVVLDITNDASKSMVSSGSQNVEMMVMNFNTAGETVELEALNLKISGAEGGDIRAAYLTSAGKVIAKAAVSNNRINFSRPDFVIGKDSSSSIKLMLDLSANFKVGSRFRLDIENPEDLKLGINGDSFSVNGYYPIRGEYLTISL